MNAFEQLAGGELQASGLDVLQVNVGLKCNLACTHCHLEAGPHRTEVMDEATLDKVARAALEVRPALVDVTGGSPELNPGLPGFLRTLRGAGLAVQVRTNLAILTEPGFEHYYELYAGLGIGLVASLPCYLAENVDPMRGAGVHSRVIEAMRRLNALGYAQPGGPALDLVFNHPLGPYLPPDEKALEGDYRKALSLHGVAFSNLRTITNMPLGRYLEELESKGQDKDYWSLLREKFNPDTLGGLMCRSQVNVGWDGALYDCDFNQALGLRINHGAPDHIDAFDRDALAGRVVVTGPHCLGCTAGAGSSCKGALA
ncbi:arsenosugar biosynthesis radical SAM (seleno)protein ArsS [Fundidesulfovibrio agrisoli]|uniref:arsenosugar biosynthesis radical SAM (seleno)protein ArsS n=1 Tax=Fundidesulfovibrio agrisoli TaxID=2922717 RepID=UPI001FACAB90|nr:arsenosugar biosynthesis radical SAM (seleno)protein ArsS [Fundidesulfovibrio agrisoli]